MDTKSSSMNQYSSRWMRGFWRFNSTASVGMPNMSTRNVALVGSLGVWDFGSLGMGDLGTLG
eukprot:2977146-Lingulodinium_polyedra.AAC.1